MRQLIAILFLLLLFCSPCIGEDNLTYGIFPVDSGGDEKINFDELNRGIADEIKKSYKPIAIGFWGNPTRGIGIPEYIIDEGEISAFNYNSSMEKENLDRYDWYTFEQKIKEKNPRTKLLIMSGQAHAEAFKAVLVDAGKPVPAHSPMFMGIRGFVPVAKKIMHQKDEGLISSSLIAVDGIYSYSISRFHNKYYLTGYWQLTKSGDIITHGLIIAEDIKTLISKASKNLIDFFRKTCFVTYSIDSSPDGQEGRIDKYTPIETPYNDQMTKLKGEKTTIRIFFKTGECRKIERPINENPQRIKHKFNKYSDSECKINDK